MSDDMFRIGMVIPFHGPGGIWGASAQAATDFAIKEINATGGILGREARSVLIDGGQDLGKVSTQVRQYIDSGGIDALSGWHTSAVRETLIPVVAGQIPYAYPAQYEGGAHSNNVYCIGETPSQQVEPALSWLRDNEKIKTWSIVGDNYIWPWKTTTFVESIHEQLGIEIESTCFLNPEQIYSEHLTSVVSQIRQTNPDGVLLLMVGQNAARFNREFARQQLQDTIIRFCPLIEENTLLASGSGATRNLYTAGGYFPTLATDESLSLLERFVREKGLNAPVLGSTAEACYEGILALRCVMEHATVTSVPTDRSNPTFAFHSARGSVCFTQDGASQTIYIARASHFNFEVIDTIVQ